MSLMRDAPNVDARSAYQPRHPSTAERVEGQPLAAPPTAQNQFQFEPPLSEDDGQPISIIAEPPIVEDDTRPRPAMAAATPAEFLHLTATGWRDTTRVAGGDPNLWLAILTANRQPVLDGLDRLGQAVAKLRESL